MHKGIRELDGIRLTAPLEGYVTSSDDVVQLPVGATGTALTELGDGDAFECEFALQNGGLYGLWAQTSVRVDQMERVK